MVATSNNWEELPCGIYSISFEYELKSTLYNKLSIVGNIKKHDWTDALLKILIKWERKLVNPSMNGHYLIAAPLEDKGANLVFHFISLSYKMKKKTVGNFYR